MDKIKDEEKKEIEKKEIEKKDVDKVLDDEENDIEEKKDRKLQIGLGIVGAIIIGTYLGGSLYFKDRFLIGSEINSISVASNTLEEAKIKLNDSIKNYKLVIKGKDIEESIKADEINLEFRDDEKLNNIIENQNPFYWIGGFFNPVKEVLNNSITYDEKKLKAKINNLEYFKGKNIKEPKDASIYYDNGEFKIKEEEEGNKVNKKILEAKIKEAIKNGSNEINLEELGCYEKPKITKDSNEIKDAKSKLENMINTNITYSYGGKSITLDKKDLGKIIGIDKKMNPIVKKDNLLNFVNEAAQTFTTVGKNRTFKNSYGNNITIGGGNYGYAIDKKAMINEIEKSLKDGKDINKEPILSQTGNGTVENDIGNTYVEISLSGQHIWFYKDGKLITESNIVTGNLSKGWGTPAGVYKLTYKQRDAVLRGEGYATPVEFWMPFNGGIGLHDATWRGTFGGEIYKTNGSHGCVNLPYKVAETIYANIDGSMPIILYN